MNIYTIHLINPIVKPLIRMEHEPVEDIPHCHHHHHHLQYHTHHHHHGPSHEVPRSMGEQNKAHYKYEPFNLLRPSQGLTRASNAPPALFRWPWIIELCNQISKELRSNIDWIGIRPPSSRPTKLLDYACGDGVASRVRSTTLTVELYADFIRRSHPSCLQ